MSLNVTVGADISAYNTAIKSMGPTAQKAANDVSKALSNAAMETDKLGGAALSSSQKMMQMRSGISAARDGVLAFTVGGQAAERSLLAMGHHINSLVNETGSFKGALGALGGSLWGPGGVILGISVAVELFLKYSSAEKEAYDATKHFTDVLQAQNSVINNLDDSYGKAVSNVFELKENVDLAKKGFIDKSSVVKEYNDTLGKTMGLVTSLDDVEKKLISGAPDYIKMMLYKAAATTALKEASDKAIEAAKVALKPQEDFKPNAFTQFSLGQSSAPGFVGTSPTTGAQQAQTASQIADANRAKEKAKFDKDQADLLKIFTDFQTKAANIAKQNKWSFTGDDVNMIEAIRQKIKQLQEDILAHPENKAADLLQIKALKKQLEELNPSIKNTKTLMQQWEEQLRNLESVEADAVAKGHIPDFFNPTKTEQSIIRLKAQIDAVKELNTELGKVPKDVLTQKDAVKSGDNRRQGIGVTATPFGGDSNDVIKGMQATIAATKAKNDFIISSRANEKQMKKEEKAGQQVIRVFGTGLQNAFEQALSGTQSFISALSGFIVQLIEKLAAAAAAAAILAVLLNATGFGTVLGSAASFGSIFGSLSGLSAIGSHAEGGIFTKEHIGRFGEAGPEAIVTPKHLQDFAGVNSTANKVQIEPFMIGPQMWFRQTTRTNKVIGRTS